MHYKIMLGAAMCASLAACGGGGESTSATPMATPNGKTQYAAYAAPAGALCAQVSNDFQLNEYCVEPTSSSATALVLQQYLLNPSGRRVHFALPGFNITVDQTGRHYLGMVTRDAYVGEGLIKLDSLTYGSQARTWSLTPDLYALIADSTAHQLTIDSNDTAVDWIQINRTNISSTQDPNSAVTTLTWDTWNTVLGQLTDWTDAPDATTLTYAGSLSIDGGPSGTIDLPDGSNKERWATGSCDVTVTFDVRLGVLRVVPSNCTGSAQDVGTTIVGTATTGGYLEFSVRGSRISPRYTWPTQLSVSNSDLGVNVSGETVNDVTGGVFGSQAHSLYIEGHSSLVGFRLAATLVSGQ